MAGDTLRSIRLDAKRRGLQWRDVCDCYRELRQLERERREYSNAVRQAAWQSHSSPGCWPFWRHGFASRYGARVERSDMTVIPGYDTLAQEIAADFHEYARDDGCQRLWDFLLSPYDRMPTAAELYEQAIEDLASGIWSLDEFNNELLAQPF